MDHSPHRHAINLALQGGGAHGAFTWGVLDRLLEDDRIRIEGISGTSAGAMNAVVAAYGLLHGGEHAARDALTAFWKDVSDAARTSPFRRSPVDILLGRWSLDTSPSYVLYDLWSRIASPYDVNPLNVNPLRELLGRHIDFGKLAGCWQMKVYVSATAVETGQVRVFTGADLTMDAVLASACLPLLYQAVEIDGAPYWDGGYAGNPVLFPFFDGCTSDDVVIVQINPIERPGTPKTAAAIANRMNEINFNASLIAELRAIDFVHRLHKLGRLEGLPYRDIHVHRIDGAEELAELGASSKLNAEWEFLTLLRDIGRRRAALWLESALPHLGKRSTLDLHAVVRERGHKARNSEKASDGSAAKLRPS